MMVADDACGIDVEIMFPPDGGDLVAENDFSRRGATDVTEAHE
jgi:hypothetical protein